MQRAVEHAEADQVGVRGETADLPGRRGPVSEGIARLIRTTSCFR